MVELEVEEIEQIIRPCGLAPRKSKAIWELSQILLAEHDGQVPPDLAALERLPGVDTKPRKSCWRRTSVCRPFPWIPTSIG